MSNLKYSSLNICADEKRLKNSQYHIQEDTKAQFQDKSNRSLQNLRPINLPGLWRKS
jgi:hypothetical protein